MKPSMLPRQPAEQPYLVILGQFQAPVPALRFGEPDQSAPARLIGHDLPHQPAQRYLDPLRLALANLALANLALANLALANLAVANLALMKLAVISLTLNSRPLNSRPLNSRPLNSLTLNSLTLPGGARVRPDCGLVADGYIHPIYPIDLIGNLFQSIYHARPGPGGQTAWYEPCSGTGCAAKLRPAGPRRAPAPERTATARKVAAVEAQLDHAGQRVPGRLVVRTVEIPDPGDLLARLPGQTALAWIRRGDGLVGWGESARVIIPAGEDRFTAGEKWLREVFDGAAVTDELSVPGSGPVAFGSFTFDPASDGSVLVVPRMVMARRAGQAWLTTINDGLDEQQAKRPLLPPVAVRWHDGSLSAMQWQRAVAAAVARIRTGDLGKVVLARDLYAAAAEDIDVRLLLGRLAARYPDCYTFSCAGLAGATPELLIRREGLEVTSLVLAGTAPRGASPGEDDALGAALLASAKDVEEHAYAVADVRASLAPRCSELSIDPQPSLLRLANVQHLATRVHGQLVTSSPDRAHPAEERTPPTALAIAAGLHPTAAVCGTPAGPAMELIRELEGMDRGRYAGPVGWVDAQGNGEWGIALRCAELDGPRARLFAGCGIVADSDPAAELAEAQVKFWPVQDALER
jgi:menaquinone-specific isochorismate synthase